MFDVKNSSSADFIIYKAWVPSAVESENILCHDSQPVSHKMVTSTLSPVGEKPDKMFGTQTKT